MSKAIRCFAVETGARLVDVSEDDVRNSELGVAGYAALFEKTPAAPSREMTEALPKAARRGTRRRSPVLVVGLGARSLQLSKKSRGISGGNLAGKEEKEVKELLAQEQSSDNTMSMITIEMGKGDAASWVSSRTTRVAGCRCLRPTPIIRSFRP